MVAGTAEGRRRRGRTGVSGWGLSATGSSSRYCELAAASEWLVAPGELPVRETGHD
jgi:hypothetical protein